MDIIEACKELDDDKLLKYLHEEIELKGKYEELIRTDENGWTSLDLVMKHKNSAAVMLKLIEIGGRELVMKKGANESTNFILRVITILQLKLYQN